jgi:hypothetical protein
MNNEFSVEFFAYFIMSLSLTFVIMSLWVMYDLDRDDKKPRKHKIKKA